MDQVQQVTVAEQANWWQSRCRSLVLNELDKVKDANLIIREGDSELSLGESDAELSAIMSVHDFQAYVDFVKGGSIGAAEAYIKGLWSSPDLTTAIRFFARCQTQVDALEKNKSLVGKLKNWLFHKANLNSRSGSKKNIVAHYDLGNELYTRFLDKEMMYSAAIYQSDEDSLESAQLNKLEAICQKLRLKKDDHLIEIGTGWGGMAIYAAQHYGCKVTTTTISEEQFSYAKNRIEQLGLEHQITLLKKDYRDLTGEYDKLVSVEMIEAVGKEYLDSFFIQCNRLLKPNGRMLIQAITIADQRFNEYSRGVDFIQRYIFPGGCLPSIAMMSDKMCRHTDMVIDSLDDIGRDYAKTLVHWRQRFDSKWHELSLCGYQEDFRRLWTFYFCYCEGAFWERKTSTVHLTARKPLALD